MTAEKRNSIKVVNERGEDMVYHLSHMLWKVPAEHTVDNKQFAAELQVYHYQLASNRIVALSLLFSLELYDEALNNGIDIRRLKTCFVEAFDFSAVGSSADDHEPFLNIPLREFINFVP